MLPGNNTYTTFAMTPNKTSCQPLFVALIKRHWQTIEQRKRWLSSIPCSLRGVSPPCTTHEALSGSHTGNKDTLVWLRFTALLAGPHTLAQAQRDCK